MLVEIDTRDDNLWLSSEPSPRAHTDRQQCLRGRELGTLRAAMEVGAVIMRRLRTLPREAVPGLLEAVMDCTAVDASSLLTHLLHSVPPFLQQQQVPTTNPHLCTHTILLTVSSHSISLGSACLCIAKK